MSFTRAGVDCSEALDSAEVPLTGDVRLTLTAEGDAPLTVESVAFPDPPGWRVRGTESPVISDQPGQRQRWRQSFRLTPDRPGDLPLQPPIVRVRTGTRETPVEINWRPLTAHVTTTIARADVDEARGATGPEPAPVAPLPLWKDERSWAAVIVIIAVGAAGLAGRRQRLPPAPEPPAAEWASAGLDRLGQQNPDGNALAVLLREFVARQYHIPAAGTTTAELLKRLANVTNVVSWQALLDWCDIVRFANRVVTTLEWTTILDDSRRVVTETLPIAEPADSAGVSAAGENA